MYKLQDIYNKTIDFAGKAHKFQELHGKRYSYLVHLSNVCMEVQYFAKNNNNLDEELLIKLALLHDTIEDTDITYEEILENFDKDTANGVLALSKDENMKKEEAMKDSLKRIKKEKKEVWIVKMADRITNLQEPPHYWSNEKIQLYLEEAKLIYNELKDADTYVSERLLYKINEYKKFIK